MHGIMEKWRYVLLLEKKNWAIDIPFIYFALNFLVKVFLTTSAQNSRVYESTSKRLSGICFFSLLWMSASLCGVPFFLYSCVVFLSRPQHRR